MNVSVYERECAYSKSGQKIKEVSWETEDGS